MGEDRGKDSMSHHGNEPTWSTTFASDPEQLCKGRREGLQAELWSDTPRAQLGPERQQLQDEIGQWEPNTWAHFRKEPDV